MKEEFATFGGGCFWGAQAAFDAVEGIIETAVGYMGGTVQNPTYEEVATRMTGHVEVVYVKYDASIVTFKDLLIVFWNSNDPTQGNRQGPNIGPEYRSVIFYHSEKQKKEAENSRKAEQKKYKKKITTTIEKATTFYRAEEYHQKYAQKHGRNVC